VEAGFGAGQLLLVPSALLAISTVGWRTTLLGAAVLLSAGIAPILGRHLRDRPADVGLLPIGGPLPAATGFVDTHLIPLAQDRGIPGSAAGLAVALLAAANVTGILASGRWPTASNLPWGVGFGTGRALVGA
jgi:hypothetical protein